MADFDWTSLASTVLPSIVGAMGGAGSLGNMLGPVVPNTPSALSDAMVNSGVGGGIADSLQSILPVPGIKPPAGIPQTQAQAEPDIFDQAKKQYPILGQYDMQYKMSPGRGGGFLEFWPPGEEGSPDLPRPKEFDIKKPGVEVYDKNTKPEDILGDVVSHHLVNVDPQLKADYANFEKSLTPKQKDKLQEQYQWAQKNEGDTRSYQDWYKASGLPGFFRGYLFNQWENPERIYTPEQIKTFDAIKERLKKPAAAAKSTNAKDSKTGVK